MADLALHTEIEEQQAMVSILQRAPLPASVVAYDVRVYEDSSGESALWVYLTVNDKKVSSDSKKLNEIRRFISEVQKSALFEGISRWPYFEFRNKR